MEKNGFLPFINGGKKKPKNPLNQTPKKSPKLAARRANQMKGPAEVLSVINLEIKMGTPALRTALPLSTATYGVFKTCLWFSITHKLIV